MKFYCKQPKGWRGWEEGGSSWQYWVLCPHSEITLLMCASLSALYIVPCVRVLGVIPVSLTDFVVSQKRKKNFFLRAEWGGREGERICGDLLLWTDPSHCEYIPPNSYSLPCPPDPHGQWGRDCQRQKLWQTKQPWVSLLCFHGHLGLKKDVLSRWFHQPMNHLEMSVKPCPSGLAFGMVPWLLGWAEYFLERKLRGGWTTKGWVPRINSRALSSWPLAFL